MIVSHKFLLFLILEFFIEVKCAHNFSISRKQRICYYKYADKTKTSQRTYFNKKRRKEKFLLQLGNGKTDIDELKTDECNEPNENKCLKIVSNENNLMDMDLFSNDSLKLSQWYSAQKVKEKWQEKHIDNIRKNYQKVLLNNKYNELFNMYRNVNNNNIENFKKRVKTNRINPSIYVKKRLVHATAKYIKMSFIKTRKILWKIRYMPIIKAFAFLYYYGTNKYTVNIYKCIKSCLYNAINKYGKDNIRPVFHTLQANMGGYTKKINIRAKGKTDIIREPHTHIRVVLEV